MDRPVRETCARLGPSPEGVERGTCDVRLRPSFRSREKVVVESSFFSLLPSPSLLASFLLLCLLCSLVRDLKCTMEEEKDAALRRPLRPLRLRRRFSNLISVIADHAATSSSALIVVVAVCPLASAYPLHLHAA